MTEEIQNEEHMFLEILEEKTRKKYKKSFFLSSEDSLLIKNSILSKRSFNKLLYSPVRFHEKKSEPPRKNEKNENNEKKEREKKSIFSHRKQKSLALSIFVDILIKTVKFYGRHWV